MIDVCIASLFTHGTIVCKYRRTCATDSLSICVYPDPFIRYITRIIFQISSCCYTIEFLCIGHGTISRIGDDASDDLLEHSSDRPIGSRRTREARSIRKEIRYESIESSTGDRDTDEDDEFAHGF